jgi:hypothetical protein
MKLLSWLLEIIILLKSKIPILVILNLRLILILLHVPFFISLLLLSWPIRLAFARIELSKNALLISSLFLQLLRERGIEKVFLEKRVIVDILVLDISTNSS